jgi:O-acetyl-ADP-ribose deacetylase
MWIIGECPLGIWGLFWGLRNRPVIVLFASLIEQSPGLCGNASHFSYLFMKEKFLYSEASLTFQKSCIIERAKKHFPKIQVVCDDITKLNVDGFVYYTRPDLQLGSGFGGMIRRRGGPDIQKQLNELAPKRVTEAVLTNAGRLSAKFIVHTVGPELGEPQTEKKLEHAIVNALDLCESMKAERIAIPSMGTGFHGISAEQCAVTMMKAFGMFFCRDRYLSELIICCRDPWMLPVFNRVLTKEAR